MLTARFQSIKCIIILISLEKFHLKKIKILTITTQKIFFVTVSSIINLVSHKTNRFSINTPVASQVLLATDARRPEGKL